MILFFYQRTGGNVFKGSLKRHFEKYAKGTTELVDSIYVKDILREVFRQKILKSKKNNALLESIDKVIDKLCHDITKDLRHKE